MNLIDRAHAVLRSITGRKADRIEAPQAPAPFDGTIVVLGAPVSGLLPRPALVTPYAGHKPSVKRGAKGRFESVAAAPGLRATPEEMAAAIRNPNVEWTF